MLSNAQDLEKRARVAEKRLEIVLEFLNSIDLLCSGDAIYGGAQVVLQEIEEIGQ